MPGLLRLRRPRPHEAQEGFEGLELDQHLLQRNSGFFTAAHVDDEPRVASAFTTASESPWSHPVAQTWKEIFSRTSEGAP